MDKEIYFQQIDNINYIKRSYGKQLWVQVSGHSTLNSSDAGFWAALYPLDKLDVVHRNCSWDLHVGTQGPGFVQYADSIYYEQIPDNGNSGINIVNYREFYGIRPDYIELTEEFRLLNNLYHDNDSNVYYAILDNGECNEVAKIDGLNTYIKLEYLIKYAAAKQMALLLFFDIRTSIEGSLLDNGLEKFSYDVNEEDIVFSIWGDDMYPGKTYSVLMGKKIILPPPIKTCGYWPYVPEKTYVDYIIGSDDYGGPKMFTSNPDELSNNFIKRPGAPHYLTPVFFKKEVLQKYLSHPETYEVTDGFLGCGDFWGLYIDNHHKDCISVYLGDLGRDLPEQEQLHWKSYNILSSETLSEVKFKRDFCGLFTSPEISDLVFKDKYTQFQKNWNEKYGWDFFLSLSESDLYNFSSLTLPVTNEQAEFDKLILSLVKVIVDSLNEKEIRERVQSKDSMKGITLLKTWFAELGLNEYEPHIKFLRNLQELRSSGTGHRKGSNYEKISKVFGIGEKSYIDIFDNILISANSFLEFLSTNFLETHKESM